MSTNLIGGIIEIGSDKQPITPDLVLAYRSGEKIGILNNVNGLVNSRHLMSASEISFDVHKMMEGSVTDLWSEVKDFRLIYIPHLGSAKFNPWYELSVTIDESDETIKHCTGTHVQEAELSQLSLNNIEINTEDDIARDDYVPTVLYNENNPDGSLLDRILHDKATHYSIYHVDTSLKNMQRTFSWDGSTILDAFNDISEELECLFIYGETTTDDGKIHRTISVYDLEDVCLTCGARGDFHAGICTKCGSGNIRHGYGENTGIFASHENFAESIDYSSNSDEVKNCFRLVAGDDLMTATIRNIIPNGSQYIWHLSDELRGDMSLALQSKLADYDEDYAEWESTADMEIDEDLITQYNALVEKYQSYEPTLSEIDYPIIGYSAMTDAYYQALDFEALLQTTLAPVSAHGGPTTAAEEAAKLTSQTLSPIGVQNSAIASLATLNSAVVMYAKVYVDTALYGITVESSSVSDLVWTGVLRLTSYTDDEDTATTSTLVIEISSDQAEYLRCLTEKAMKRNGEDASGTKALFELNNADFAEALSYYSVDNLEILASICRSCIDVLIERGVATPTSASYGNVYEEIYVPYYQKNRLIELEMTERELEVAQIHDLLLAIDKKRKEIISSLDLRTYLGETLWAEFCSYRRDDEYKNDNYISDGLTDSELIDRARLFVETANKELVKSATLQHTISCNLYDILLVREKEIGDSATYGTYQVDIAGETYTFREDDTFSPLLKKFDTGNWLIIEVDEKAYKLRMTDYEISYDDLSKLNVGFSDVVYGLGSISDLQSVLGQARSMATSYSYTQRQAVRGNNANNQITDMVENGLYLTNKKIVNSAENQNMIVDESGLLMREMDEYDDAYSPEQTKIINRGFYYTNDDWNTVQTGLGRYMYFDPIDGEYKEDYGLIARKIVGNIILGNDLSIYNTSGSFVANQNGVTITGSPGEDNSSLFTIQKDNGDGTVTRYMYIGDDGVLHLGADTIDENYNSLSQSFSEYTAQNDAAIAGINSSISDIEEDSSDYRQLRNLYLEFDPNNPSQGLKIGGKTATGDESLFDTTITNEQMSFNQNGTTIAYINGQKYHIARGEIEQSLTVGPFEWRVEEDALNLILV